jgi:hypothetical protein
MTNVVIGREMLGSILSSQLVLRGSEGPGELQSTANSESGLRFLCFREQPAGRVFRARLLEPAAAPGALSNLKIGHAQPELDRALRWTDGAAVHALWP